jgi:hypothetical protein
MSIGTYSDLQTAVANWLARSDLTARIPEFITLAEAKFNRLLDVRQMEQRSTTTIATDSTDPQYISLPTDFQSMRRVCLSSVTGKPTIEYLTPTALYEMRFGTFADDTGQPAFFTIIGSEIELLPVPDQDYTIEMVYRKVIPALSDSTTTNWLLTLAPDAYLYGSLMEASLFTQNDERVPVWAQMYKGAIDALTSLNFTSAYNAGPISVRAVGVTP